MEIIIKRKDQRMEIEYTMDEVALPKILLYEIVLLVLQL
jgi:hypothetical protein